MTPLRSGSQWEKLDVDGSVIVALTLSWTSQSIIIRLFLFSLLIV